MTRAALISFGFMAPVAAASDVFVSLAYDEFVFRHGFGLHADLATSQELAMAACADVSENCKLIYVRANVCMSLAVGLESGAWAADIAKTAEIAEVTALENCAENNNANACQVLGTRCWEEIQEKT